MVNFLKKLSFCVFFNCIFLSGKITDVDFWADYQSILDEVVIIGNYTGKHGNFFHNAVDYEKIHKENLSGENLSTKFDNQVKKLKAAPREQIKNFTENEKLAFWINAYNFFTLLDIKNHYPIDSMKDLGWKNKRFQVADKKYSLDNLEHAIIRSTKVPEIHFAVNCASVSCPTLYQKVFHSSSIRKDLAFLTRNAFKNPIHIRLEKKIFSSEQRIVVTKLLAWYKEDFGKDDKEVLGFIYKYAPEQYQDYDDYNAGLNYNWDLNSNSKIKDYLKRIQ